MLEEDPKHDHRNATKIGTAIEGRNSYRGIAG